MSDQTERLRALLDERGVEYETRIEIDTGIEHIIWHPTELSQWDWNEEFGAGWLTGWQQGVTPEQAIAATLGISDTEDASTDTDGHDLGHVRDVSATLGSCNCSNSKRTEACRLDDFADVPFSVDYEIEGYDMGSSRDYATLAECNSCGAYVIVPPSYHHVLTCDGDEVYQPYRFCPNCGRRIEVDE